MATMIDRVQLMQLRAIMEVGYRKCAAECGLLKPYISQKEAFDKYGRGTVERWIDEGLIVVVKDGPGSSKCRIKRDEIELVAATSNRESWFENHVED